MRKTGHSIEWDKWVALKPILIDYIRNQYWDSIYELYPSDMAEISNEIIAHFGEYFHKDLCFDEDSWYDESYLRCSLYTDLLGTWRKFSIVIEWDCPSWYECAEWEYERFADNLIRYGQLGEQIMQELTWYTKKDFIYFRH